MASAIIETVVEEVVEETVEATVEQTVEETVEATVEESVEETVEETVEQTVEESVETSVEESVENSVEDTVEDTVEQATSSTIKRRLLVLIGGLVVGLVIIGPIIGAIKAAVGAGKKKCELDSDTEEGMDKTTNVLDVLQKLVSSWAEQLKTFKQDDSLGQVDYKGKKADAAGTVFTIFDDMKKQLNAASRIATECSGNCAWKANLQQFKLDVILGAYDVQAIFTAKENASVMKDKNFPPETDREKMMNAFNSNYKKEWVQLIQLKAKKNLSKAVEAQAKAASQAAVKKVISGPMKKEVKGGMEKQVVPDVKAQALAAAKAQVKVVMNRYNADINNHAAIPIYGIATLKSWMEKNVKPTAVKEATAKAKAAADATMELPPAQIKMMTITSDAQHKVLSKYSAQIKQAANQAAEDAIKKALQKEHGNN